MQNEIKTVTVTQNPAVSESLTVGLAPCGCGRSPKGYCIGWHTLTEEEFQSKLAEHIAEKQDE